MCTRATDTRRSRRVWAKVDMAEAVVTVDRTPLWQDTGVVARSCLPAVVVMVALSSSTPPMWTSRQMAITDMVVPRMQDTHPVATLPLVLLVRTLEVRDTHRSEDNTSEAAMTSVTPRDSDRSRDKDRAMAMKDTPSPKDTRTDPDSPQDTVDILQAPLMRISVPSRAITEADTRSSTHRTTRSPSASMSR